MIFGFVKLIYHFAIFKKVGKYENKQIFQANFISFHKILCNFISTICISLEQFLLYDYLLIVSKSIYTFIMYIISQNLQSY